MAGLFERLLKSVGLRKDTREDVIPPGWVLRDVTSYGIGGKQEVPPAPQDFLDEYRRALLAYSAVSAKARAAGGAPWVLKRERKGDDEVISDHPVLDLLRNPAPKFTWETMIEHLVMHLDLAGCAYLEKARGVRSDGAGPDEDSPVRQLLRLFPDRMKPIISLKGGLDGYEYRPNWNVRPISFKPKDVLHVFYLDPLRDFLGCGPMSAAFMASRMDTAATRWNASFFNNGAHPDVILSTDKPMPPEERKRIKTEYQDPQKGPVKGRGVYFAPFGINVSQFGLSHREMQFERLKGSVRGEICAAFHVPPVLLGWDTATYASAQIQMTTFRDYVLVPLLRSIFAAIKESVLSEFDDGEDLYLDVDLSEMRMPEERDRDFNRALVWFQAGLIDENEARAMARIPPLTPAQIKAREEKKKAEQEAQRAAQAAQMQATGAQGGPPGQPKSKEQVGKPDSKDAQPKAQGADEAAADEVTGKPGEPADQAQPKKKKKKLEEEEKGKKPGANGAAKKSEDGAVALRKRWSGIPWDDILGEDEEEAEE